MSDTGYAQLLDLAGGAFLLTAVLVLWRREASAIVRLLAVQGVALTAIVAVLAAREGSLELAVITAGVLVLRAGLLPRLVRRSLAGRTRGTAGPPVNVITSLIAAVALTLLGFAIARPVTVLAGPPAGPAVPLGLAVALIGFLYLVNRRGSGAPVIGFLLVDNGITAVAMLAGTEVALLAGLVIALDAMFVVLASQSATMEQQEAPA